MGFTIARRDRHSLSSRVSTRNRNICIHTHVFTRARLYVICDSHERGLHADWIPEYLQTATKNSLRVEMQKARASSDVEGYIYAFEILGMPSFLTAELSHPAGLLIESLRLFAHRSC